MLQPNHYYGGELTTKENEWYSEMGKLNSWIKDIATQKSAYDAFYKIVIAGPLYKDPVHFNASKAISNLYKYFSRNLSY